MRFIINSMEYAQKCIEIGRNRHLFTGKSDNTIKKILQGIRIK